MSFVDRISNAISTRTRTPDAGDRDPAHYVRDDAPLGNDELGSYLLNHDTPQAAARHSSAVARLAIVVLGISLCLNALLAIAVLQMFPLYRVVPFFVTFSDKADQVVTIDAPKANLTNLAILNEANVRTYVTARHTISADPYETYHRWQGVVHTMSAPAVYSAFLEETKPIYNDLTQKKFTRAIRVLSITQPSPGFYRVEFEATDRRLGQGLTDSGEDRRTFVADMRFVNAPQTVRNEDRFLNPVGFTVINYSVAPKK